MGKFDRVLLASDFDHTMTSMQNEIPPENLEAIRYFMEEGGAFTIASGRSVPMFRKRAGEVPMNAPCILYNGAACYDYGTETMEYACPLPPEALDIPEELMKRFSQRVEIQTADCHYVYGEDPYRDAYLRKNETPFRPALGPVPQPWLKIAVYGPSHGPCFQGPETFLPGELEETQAVIRYLQERCLGGYTVVRSMPRIVEIFHRDCSKGGAARALARRLGRPLLACCGDAPNDTSMLLEADYPFCPCDGDPEVLALPRIHVTGSCNEGCVAQAVRWLETAL